MSQNYTGELRFTIWQADEIYYGQAYAETQNDVPMVSYRIYVLESALTYRFLDNIIFLELAL